MTEPQVVETYTLLDGEMKDYKKGETVGMTFSFSEEVAKDRGEVTSIIGEAVKAIQDAKKYGKTSQENNLFMKLDAER